MEENVPPPLSSERPGQASQESSQDSIAALPTTDSITKSKSEAMEFAQMPSNHYYGPYANPSTMFDMSDMSGSLPQYSHPHYPAHFMPQISQGSTIHPALAYASPPNQQWASHIANQYTQHYPSTMHSSYTPHELNTNQSATDIYGRRHMIHQQQVPYAINMMQPQQYQDYRSQHGPYVHPHVAHYDSRQNMQYPASRSQLVHRGSSPTLANSHDPGSHQSNVQSKLQVSTALRGPPRKAKQSGHALWVGNLPPGTNIIDLKDHLAREATEEIQSVFLIAKTNCAFVNYKTAESCAAAMMRFHDSKFRQMRLVCRLRRGSSPGSASEFSQNDVKQPILPQQPRPDTIDTTNSAVTADEPGPAVPTRTAEKLVKEKFFIIKSLTREDVDRAVSSGTWATQAQNEENLNLAYDSAENVYLIFSVNKSSEYYGYARMESPISGDVVQVRETAQQPPIPTSTSDGPTIIPTPATATAPRGYIVDDSARGNIFWEAENDASSPNGLSAGTTLSPGEASGDEGTPDMSPQPSNVGRPFRISWMSTEKLPFIRTRGLRNPWNSNREIKIARDGTEVEPNVGRRLVTMFEQQAQMAFAASRQPNIPVQQGQQHGSYPSMMHHAGYAYGGPGQSGLPHGRPY